VVRQADDQNDVFQAGTISDHHCCRGSAIDGHKPDALVRRVGVKLGKLAGDMAGAAGSQHPGPLIAGSVKVLRLCEICLRGDEIEIEWP
jgi:hypothetical protein